MRSDELRAIIDAMTPGPWRDTGAGIESSAVGGNGDMSVVTLGEHYEENNAAIVELANHADALVELLSACELLRGGNDDFVLVKIDHALRRVHSVAK